MVLAAFTPPPPQVQVVQPSRSRLSWPASSEESGPPPPEKVKSHGWDYTIKWNTLLGRDTLRRVVAQSKDPRAAVNGLEAAYRKAGYFLVALRASGNAKAHKVTIEVIEGAFNELTASGGVSGFYDGLLFDPQVSYDDLLRANVLAQSYASRQGQRLSLQVSPGKAEGASALSVSAEALPNYKPWHLNLVFGNYGNRYSDRYLGQVYGSVNLGFGLELHGNYSRAVPQLTKSTRGSSFNQYGFGGSDVTPWGVYGLNLTHTLYRVGDVAKPYYPTGNVTNIAGTGTQLVFASVNDRISVNEGVHWVKDKVQVLDGYYTLTDQQYAFLSLGMSASHSLTLGGRSGSLSGSVAANQGVSPAYGTIQENPSPGAPTSRFRYYTMEAQWQQSLPWDFTLKFNGTGQWSEDTLPSDQRWLLGGFGSLSAYYPGVVSGDSGYLARLGVETPSKTLWGVSAKGSLTFASGGAHDYFTSPRSYSWQRLSDVEFGLTFTTKWKTQLRLVSAVPIGHSGVSAPQRRQSRNYLYFVLTQSF